VSALKINTNEEFPTKEMEIELNRQFPFCNELKKEKKRNNK